MQAIRQPQRSAEGVNVLMALEPIFRLVHVAYRSLVCLVRGKYG